VQVDEGARAALHGNSQNRPLQPGQRDHGVLRLPAGRHAHPQRLLLLLLLGGLGLLFRGGIAARALLAWNARTSLLFR
jgi:hypothetical protein